MRLPDPVPGPGFVQFFLLLLFIERQFTLFPGVRVPQPPATAGLRAARLARGRPWA